MIRSLLTPKPVKGYAILLLFAYLLVEISFNALLVDVATSHSVTSEELSILELMGRTISGIGACILFAQHAAKYFKPSNSRLFNPCNLVLLVVWLTVFFGQKILIDYFIDNSTAAERQEAFLAQTIELSSSEIPTSRLAMTDDLGTKAVMASLLFFDGIAENEKRAMFDGVKNDRHTVSKIVQGKILVPEQDVLYLEFLAQRQLILSLYDGYRHPNLNMINSFKKLDQQANEAWSELERLYENYAVYKNEIVKAGKKIHNREWRKIGGAVRSIYSKDCRRKPKCLAFYRKNYAKRVKGTVLEGTLLKDWLPSDGSEPPSFQVITPERLIYYKKKFVEVAITQKAGFKNAPTSFSAFIRDKRTQHRIKSALPKEMVYTSSIITNKAQLKELIAQSSEIAHYYTLHKLPKKLSLRSFLNNSQVREIIAAQVDGEIDANLFVYDNKAAFIKNVLPEIFISQIKTIESQINARKEDFQPSGKYFSAGVESLRGVIVVPLAMCLSLLFVLLVFIKLTISLLTLFMPQEKGLCDAVATSLFVLFFALPMTWHIPLPLRDSEYHHNALLQWISIAQPPIHYAGIKSADLIGLDFFLKKAS